MRAVTRALRISIRSFHGHIIEGAITTGFALFPKVLREKPGIISHRGLPILEIPPSKSAQEKYVSTYAPFVKPINTPSLRFFSYWIFTSRLGLKSYCCSSWSWAERTLRNPGEALLLAVPTVSSLLACRSSLQGCLSGPRLWFLPLAMLNHTLFSIQHCIRFHGRISKSGYA